jgi:molybdopterin converting factor subunit 1
MTISVRLFARARDLADSDTLNVELPQGATVADLRRRVAATCPALREFLPRCAVAVGDDFAADEVTISNDAEVAIIPPVSGG